MGFVRYVKDTRGEMRHVAWPTQKQTVVYTALVIAISLLTAAYVGAFDFLFTRTLETGLDVETSQASTFTPSIEATGESGQKVQVTNVTPEGETEAQFNITPTEE